MKQQLGLLATIVSTTLAGGFIAIGCAASQTTYIYNDDAGPDSSTATTSSGRPGTSSGTSGASGGSSGTSGTSGGSSGTSGTSGTAGGCPSNATITAASLPWKPPAQSLGSCTQTQLDTLVSYITANSAATYPQWKANGVTNATCRACIFGNDSGTTWAPLVEDGSGALAELNVGGCIAIASNSVACGKAYQNWFDCGFEACKACPDANTLSTCRDSVNNAGKACESLFNNVTTVCTDPVITAAETKCQGTKYVFEGGVKAQCIAGVN